MGHKTPSKKSLIVRHKQGRKHITNCKAKNFGYCQTSEKFTQIHHILCLAALTDARIAKDVKGKTQFDRGQMQFIRECLKLTKWNINDAGDVNGYTNVVGLPLKRAFVKKPAAEWDGWPCHQVEHNPMYTSAVCARLYEQVWKEAIKLRKKCQKCKTECLIEAKTLQEQLKLESEHWYKFLNKRGKIPLTTAFCWENRDKPELEKCWYIPFSMALVPKSRKPPPKTIRGSLENYIARMFKWL